MTIARIEKNQGYTETGCENAVNGCKGAKLPDPNELLVSLKARASELNKLHGGIKKKELKEIQKELAKAIKDLEELI